MDAKHINMEIDKFEFRKNSSEIYNEGYVAGYNQSQVDVGLITQNEADKILHSFGKKVDIKQTSGVDDECLSIQCICGYGDTPWTFVIDIYADNPVACPKCGRKYYFKITSTVFQVD